jgi:hypothetical protein
MTAQETNLLNAFETTLTATAGASDLTFTVNSVTDAASNTLTHPCYLVINPDSATNREVILVTSINAGTKTLTCDNINKRFLTGSAATSGLSHSSGATVRVSPVQQHIEDLNDRVDTIINEAGTAVNTSLFLDEDDMSSNSATKGVTQQSVKAYVDTQLTAEDLDTAGNSGTGSVDLDSQSLTVSGDGTILSSTASGQGITFSIADASTSAKGAASFSSDNFSVSSGAVTIKSGGVDLTAEVTGTLPVANGGTGATSLTDKAVLISQDSGTDTVGAVALTTSGQLIIGGTDGPAAATLTAGSNVSITNGANAITIAATDTNTTYTAGDGLDLSGTEFSTDLKSNGGLVIESTELAVDLGASSITGTLAVGDGGTGATSLTDGGVLLGSGTGAVTATSVLTNGQLLIGDGTGDPTVATLTEGSNVTITNGAGSITIASTDTNTTYTAGTLLDLSGTTFNVDLSEAAEAAIADGDYILFLDGGATGTAKKEAVADLATLLAGTGLTASSSVIGVDTSQNITALTGGDLTIYEDANNADVSLKMGTSAAESLTIEVLNGSGNKTAEQINFTTATASGTADHGKMVFAVDETTIATIDDGGIDLASGKEFSVNGTAIGSGTVDVDQYLLPADLSSDTDPITTFQRPTGTLQTHAGTGMTYSSGIFSFPKTGIWKVSIMARLKINSNTDSGFMRLHSTSDNGSAYDMILECRSEANSATDRNTSFGTTFLDVTDISNDKVKVSFDESSNATLEGGTTSISTGIFFERLGDT